MRFTVKRMMLAIAFFAILIAIPVRWRLLHRAATERLPSTGLRFRWPTENYLGPTWLIGKLPDSVRGDPIIVYREAWLHETDLNADTFRDLSSLIGLRELLISRCTIPSSALARYGFGTYDVILVECPWDSDVCRAIIKCLRLKRLDLQNMPVTCEQAETLLANPLLNKLKISSSEGDPAEWRTLENRFGNRLDWCEAAPISADTWHSTFAVFRYPPAIYEPEADLHLKLTLASDDNATDQNIAAESN